MAISTKEKDAQRGLRRERVETRVTSEEKALLQRAADLDNRSITEFIRQSAHDAAIATIQRHEVMMLGPEDAAAFVEALLHPPMPSEGLRAAFRAHRDLIGE